MFCQEFCETLHAFRRLGGQIGFFLRIGTVTADFLKQELTLALPLLP